MIKIHRLIYLKIGRGRKLKLPKVKNLKKMLTLVLARDIINELRVKHSNERTLTNKQ